MTKTKIKNWIAPATFFIVVVILWHLAVKLFSIPEYLIPSPYAVWQNITGNIGSIISDLGITMLESVLGFLLGNAFGILIAVLFVHSKTAERSVYPFMIALKAVPIVAIAPLLLIWFGFGLFGKVVMAALICFFPAIVNTTIGLKNVEPEAIDLMKSFSASKFQILFKIRFPSALPYIFSALKISSILSVIGAVVAEMAGAQEGIGFAIMMASYQVDTPTLFSSIIAVSIGGILFFGFISFLERKVLYWHEGIIS